MSIISGLLFAKGKSEVRILPNMVNRHGLIAGATGTGKTVSLKVLCEEFSSLGIPVFLADIKGDLSGISKTGVPSAKIVERIEKLALGEFNYTEFPVVFWDVYGKQGHPVRTTVSEMGALLFSKLLDLNETQSGIMNIVFKIADDAGMLLIDLKDLKAMLRYIGDHAGEFTTEYGNVSKQSIGAIQRALLTLDEQGGDLFFGEPAIDIKDFIRTDEQGRGIVNILASDQLFLSPALYSTFLLWLLSELYEELPEVGDLDKPKIVFFFDEAHLLFSEASKILLQKVEQVVRLIRSKGVGVYFITQNLNDIPETVLGQLGNRVQHALRAFTPRDQKAVKSAAETFRQNPEFKVETAIMELGVGEALVSFLDEKGIPGIVDRAFVVPPKSLIGPIPPEERDQIIKGSIFFGKYENRIDRVSAYESIHSMEEQQEAERVLLEERALLEKREQEEREFAEKRAREEREIYENQFRQSTIQSRNNRKVSGNYNRSGYGGYTPRSSNRRRSSDSPLDKLAKSTMSSIGRTVGRELVRGLLGTFIRR